MSIVRNLVSAVALTAMLGACAGRDPAPPTSIVQPQDNNLSCDQVQAEIAANNGRIQALSSEEASKRTQNIVAGTVGVVLFFPALFFMDFKNGAGKDLESANARQSYLGALAATKCNGNGYRS